MIKKNLQYSIFLLLFFIGCTPNTEKQEPEVSIFENVLAKKELSVAILNNSMSYFVYRGTPMGFQYELAKEYATHLDVDLKLMIATDYATALDMVKRGDCDILASNVSVTGQRKKEMLFSVPLMHSYPVLVQNKNSKKQYVEDWLDVDSLEIGISEQSIYKQIVDNVEESLGIGIKLLKYRGVDQEQLMDLVAEDSIPATIADKIVAKVAQTHHPNLDINIVAGLTHKVAWAMNKDALDLQQNLDDWLTKYKKKRAYRQLYVKYCRNKKSITRNREGWVKSAEQLSKYDAVLKEEAAILGWDWRLLAALIYTESRFDASQVSWAGAFGLMQLIPITAKEFGASRSSSPKQQIAAGRKYIQYLEKAIGGQLANHDDLQWMVFAAYNSGLGHFEDALRLADKLGKDKNSWEDVKECIALLRKPEYYKDEVVKYGRFRGQETINHVEQTKDLFENYKVLFPEQ